jgi:hypothetical protein
MQNASGSEVEAHALADVQGQPGGHNDIDIAQRPMAKGHCRATAASLGAARASRR